MAAAKITKCLCGGRSSGFGAALGDLLLRLVAGLSMALAHGIGKIPPGEGFIGMVDGLGFPAPTAFAWMAGISEVVGGALIALGLATRLGGLMMIGVMAVAVYHHTTAGDPYTTVEKAVMYLAIGAYYLLAGADRLSVDGMFLRKQPTPAA
jgi:putative oxidoreductase